MKRRDFLKIAAVLSVAPISGILSKPPKLKAVTPDDLVVEDSKTARISILCADNNLCNITFGGPAGSETATFGGNVSLGTMSYTHPTSTLEIICE